MSVIIIEVILILIILIGFSDALFFIVKFKYRNKALQRIADEYGLSFQVLMGPKDLLLIPFHLFKDKDVNLLWGKINEHNIEIKDIITKFNVWVTAISVNGVRKNISFTPFGNLPIFTTTDIVRKKLDKLKLS